MQNENTVSQKLGRIDSAVDRIRIATGTEGQVIENVATAAESMVTPAGNINITDTNSTDVSQYATAQVVDSNLTAENIKKDVTVLGITGTHEGGITPSGKITIQENGTDIDVSTYALADVEVSSKSNIYKVSSIAERDLIDDMVEGDMCVVISGGEAGIIADTAFQVVKFPNSVTLDTAITSSGNSRDTSYDLNISWSASMFRCQYWGETSISINYTSSDGLTYTRTDSEGNPVDFGTELTIASVVFNNILSNFMLVDTIEFPGIFTYTNNSWIQTNIGADLVASDILLNKKAYSNFGTLTGTRDMDKYREEFIYIQDTEPTNKSGIWGKIDSGVTLYNGAYNSSKTLSYAPISNLFKTTKVANTNIMLTPKPNTQAKGHCTEGYYGFSHVRFTDGTTTDGDRSGVCINNKVYLFGASKTHVIDLTDGTTNSYSVSLPAYMAFSDPHVYNGYVYFITRELSSPYYRLCKYNLSNNTGSYSNFAHDYSSFTSYSDNSCISSGKYMYSLRMKIENSVTSYMIDRYDLSSGTFTPRVLGTVSSDALNMIKLVLGSTYYSTADDGLTITTDFGYTVNLNSVSLSTLESDYNTYKGTALQGTLKIADNEALRVLYGAGAWWEYRKRDVNTGEITSERVYESITSTVSSSIYAPIPILYNNYIYLLNGSGLYKRSLDDLFKLASGYGAIEIDYTQPNRRIYNNFNVPISNMFYYTSSGPNAIKQIYFGDGTSWNLYKSYE